MDKIRGRLFYDIITGEVILHKPQINNVFNVRETSIEEDIKAFKILKERTRDSFDFIQLDFDQFAQDFEESNGWRVNPETKELEFTYPDPNESVEPPIYRAPLSIEFEELKRENSILTAQNKALADQAEFHTDVLTEIILTIAP